MRKVFFGVSISLSLLNLSASAAGPKVVISQVYGGAGCGTAGCSSYKNDFIEIFNSGSAPQDLTGWSIQYTAGTGTVWQITNLTSVTLQPGQYYLIGEGAGANGVSNIPTPDASGTIAMSAAIGKVALLNTTTPLSGACPTGVNIIDFVGYGTTANCNEGGANAPAPSTTTADVRAANGCTDANNNSTDFTATTPNPRNTTTPFSVCPAPLPVAFFSFRVQYQEATNSAFLNWSTASELNAKEFIVERSDDGNTWTGIQRVSAGGYSNSIRQYQATDADLQQGVNYYRIRQVDVDGQAQYTTVVSVKTSDKNVSFKVSPNPTTGVISVQTSLPASARVSIQVTDLSGRVVLQQQRTLSTSQLALDLSHLNKGTYFLIVRSGEILKTEKVFLY